MDKLERRSSLTLRFLMIGVFCMGVLFIGIGIGIGFTEFASLSYTGQKISELAESKEDTFTEKLVENGERVLISLYNDFSEPEVVRLTSNAVPPNSMSVKVEYETVGPKLEVRSSNNKGQDFRVRWTYMDPLSMSMMMKEEVIRDLKDGKFNTYAPILLTKVTITCNPVDESRITVH